MESLIIDWLVRIYNSIYQGWIVLILTSILIILLGLIFGKLVGLLVDKILHELEIKKLMSISYNFPRFEETVSKLVTWIIYFAAIILALRILGLADYALYVVALFLLLLIALITLLAVKDFFPNFFSGAYLREQKTFSNDDEIRFGNVNGRVVKMGLVGLVLRTKIGDLLHVPYSLLAHESVTNLSRSSKKKKNIKVEEAKPEIIES